MDENKLPEKGCLLVKDEKIEYVGPYLNTLKYDSSFDCRGGILMPSFINAHGHAPTILFRCKGDGLPRNQWLFDYIFPMEKLICAKDVYWATMLALAEQASCGITSASDIYFFSEEIVKAALDSGCKMNIALNIAGNDLEQAQERLAQSEVLYDTYHKSGGGRVRIDASFHAEYTTCSEICRQVIDFAQKYKILLHTHIVETQADRFTCIERRGVTLIDYFDKLGLFSIPTLLAHGVYLDYEEIEILARKNQVTIAHCPVRTCLKSF